MVAKGYNQKEGMDFNEVFSYWKYSSIHMLLSIITLFDIEFEQLDVKIALLHSKLEEYIYMQQPKGFVVENKKDYVCLLIKSLYSSKQSPRQWYKLFDILTSIVTLKVIMIIVLITRGF